MEIKKERSIGVFDGMNCLFVHFLSYVDTEKVRTLRWVNAFYSGLYLERPRVLWWFTFSYFFNLDIMKPVVIYLFVNKQICLLKNLFVFSRTI